MTRGLLLGFWIVSGALFIVRLVFISTTMVVEDEAYYAMYARHLAWGYIDHGPVVATLIRLTTSLFGENGFGIRVGGVLMITILGVVVYRFGERYFSRRTGVVMGLALTANVLTHTNAVVMTPDAPLFFFTTLAIMCYYRAFFDDRRYFIPGGVALGLAMLSKVSAVFPALGIFLFPFLWRRSFVKDVRFYLSFVIAATVFAPFLVWNARNDFAFFRYQGAHIAQSGGISHFGELWGGLLLLAGPFLFYYGVIRAVPLVIRRNNPNKKFFALTVVVPFVYFVAHSLVSRFELNWPAPIFCGALFVFGILIAESWESLRGRFREQMGYSLLIVLLVTAHIYGSFLPLGRKDITNQYHDYLGFRDDLAGVLAAHPETDGLRIVSNNYQYPSMINVLLKPVPEATCLSIDYHDTLYGFLYPDETLVGDDLVVVLGGDTFPGWLAKYFTETIQLGVVRSERFGRAIDTYGIWLGRSYQGKDTIPTRAAH